MIWNVTAGILIPFLGTALGAGMVFLLKKEMNELLQKVLLGFASGVMIAASVWSLLIPAIRWQRRRGLLPGCLLRPALWEEFYFYWF